MAEFDYRDGVLCAERVSLAELAERFGTPTYVYSRAAIERNFRAYASALAGCGHLLCYSVKANGNLAVLSLLARLGAGFDIVSGGELLRVAAAGGEPGKVVFSGVAKSAAEMELALERGILCFNLESPAELERLAEVARANGSSAPVSVRVNPDVDPGAHPYVATGLGQSKFGVDADTALAMYRRAAELSHLEVAGIDCHIGSQLTELGPFVAALRRLLAVCSRLAAEGIHPGHLDLGGGLGVRYRGETPPTVAEYVAALRAELAGRDLRLLLEPGRSIVADAGILLTRVEHLKSNGGRRFAIVDAAMNDMLRPALYQAWMELLPVHAGAAPAHRYHVAGPVCEAGDFLARDRELAIAEGGLLALLGAGAYGFAMSSNYNSRPRAAEVLVDGGACHLARERERARDLFALERPLPG